MSEASIEWLSSVAHTYLAIRIGEMQFAALDTCVLAIALTAAVLSALNLRRIAQSEDRQRRLLEALRRGPLHFAEPSRVPRLPWYQWLGATVAATRVIGTAAQERLLAALVLIEQSAAHCAAALIFVMTKLARQSWRQSLRWCSDGARNSLCGARCAAPEEAHRRAEPS
jgi:hypothetical protein